MVNKKKMLKYAKISLYGNRKRLRKKAWNRLLDLCGFDQEGLIDYAKAARFIKKAKI
ncbi:hypothetical protein ACFVS2_21260 [Brevibacillus sp. NPDC058079]|uniref:hypothetical protein n=1 Tax=Brevibacillus sp. NPDC058079 TaxID=3346330 RepID=UPI0036E12C83